MNNPARKIAVVGFSSFEYGAFEAFFKMVGVSRPPGFAVASSATGADLIFLNGLDEVEVQAYSRSNANRCPVVVIGPTDFGTGLRTMPRPIRLTAALAIATQIFASRPVQTSEAVANETASPPLPAARTAGVIERIASGSTHELLRPMAAPAAGLRSAPQVASPSSYVDRRMPPVVSKGHSSEPALGARDFDFNAEAVESTADDILVVDDSDIALRFMQDHLAAFGFKVHLAKSGEECLMLLSQRAFRCVFLDVMMTGIDGYQTCRMIKQRKYTGGVAPSVIMMTSRSGAIDRVRGALAGCDGYLVKPVDETKLIKALFSNRVSTSPATATTMRTRLNALTR